MGASAEAFDAYFKMADLDRDGRISGAEAVAFFKGSNLPQQILAQIWTHADRNRTGYLGREEFYNALKLVTVAQRGRQLTPEIVKAALVGPAAAKIPAPQINLPSPMVQMNSVLTSTPSTQLNVPGAQLNAPGAPASQLNVLGASAPQNPGFMGQQFPSASHLMRPPQPTAVLTSIPMQGIDRKPPLGDNLAGQNIPNSSMPNVSTDWLGGRNGGASLGGTPQVANRSVTPPVNHDSFGLSHSGLAPVGSLNLQTPSGTAAPQVAAKDSKALVVSGNGFPSDSSVGGDLFSAAPQAKKDLPSQNFAASSVPHSANDASSVVSGSQYPVKPRQLDQLQSPPSLLAVDSQLQKNQSLVNPNQMNVVQSTSAMHVSSLPAGPVGANSSTQQLSWPKITQTDIQKYTAVFIKVDKDRDGKIRGDEARNLFLSWKLPREVLRQVWELSDQDKDGMLSLREFCTAVFLMERSREGRPLPAVLPNDIWSDGVSLPSTGQFAPTYSAPAWQPSPGLSPQGIQGPPTTIPVTSMKPPARTPIPNESDSTTQPAPQKPKIPVLEKHLVDQLSKEEQSALNSKFQEAADADKRVQELEKEILDTKEKIEFYRTKMQELILYKSRCDNRLNEILERVSADKREAQSLGKKYEEKCKQLGDVASKLTIEEATFRAIQERKLELYNSIVKLQKDGSSDDSLQDRANQIQSDLEGLVKSLNEQCKQYGLRTKPTTLVELPFGWQPGIQEAADDWDEDWDKFGDDGFAIIKELTVEIEKITPPKKESPPTALSDKPSSKEESPVASTPTVESKSEMPPITERPAENDSVHGHSEDESAKSPPGSPGRDASVNHSDEIHSTQSRMFDVSPRASESMSDHGFAESSISGDKFADDHFGGPTFDYGDDADSVWGFNPKDGDDDKSKNSFFFGSADLFPIKTKTDSPTAASVYGREQKPFFDSVPSTPAGVYGREPKTFFDSVPSTPASVYGREQKTFFDSVPSTPAYNSVFSPRFSEAGDDHSFDNFSTFDSFGTNENSLFNSNSGSFARFDSFRSTADSSFPDPSPFARFDSFRSTADHGGRPETFTRFDSIRSTSGHGSGFPSFDDADPFGTGPFKISDTHSPRQGTDHWSAF
ncbi:epidermal growth factor receptor substrate 15-like isoform X1 [Ananas comosus]|uniref:Epidermal growth factor receptor substrate 15-like isoform X1 n=2 Tax=Ananas comosus TaxID=4615 RepID=A0A6P5GX79_ANACO|nr:epidermal growth factor receptor substrate 15-like isoform X1 [Ananas comosus]